MNNNILSPHKPAVGSSLIHPGRGAALVMVLASLLALSVIILGVSEKTAHQSRDASLLLLEYRASLLARTGFEIGVDLLRNLPDKHDDPSPAALDAVWQEKNLSISIFPCAARINLNHLGQTRPEKERIRNALLELFDKEDLSSDAMDFLLHWTGNLEHDQPSSSYRAIQAFYALGSYEYSSPGRVLSRPEELILVPGFEDVSLEWIRNNFTVWGDQTVIDINFAPRSVALALLPELEPYWDSIEALRQSRTISHPNELLMDTGLDIVTYSTVLPYLTLEPDLFEIVIEVRIGSWYEKHRYIVQRNMIDPQQVPGLLARDVLEARPL